MEIPLTEDQIFEEYQKHKYPDECKSLVRKHLDADTFKKVKGKKTKLGGTIAHCIYNGKSSRFTILSCIGANNPTVSNENTMTPGGNRTGDIPVPTTVVSFRFGVGSSKDDLFDIYVSRILAIAGFDALERTYSVRLSQCHSSFRHYDNDYISSVGEQIDSEHTTCQVPLWR